MRETRRRSYLKALEIDTWARRDAQGQPETAAEALQQAAPELPTAVYSAESEKTMLKPQALRIAESAAVPGDWPGLREAVRTCRKCRLCETRTQTVFGVGPDTAPLMVVGEGPGADEDAQGEPFVGRAGKLLDEMLKAIGRSRKTDTFIANVVKCRPPGNREPAEDEAESCRAYLEQQLRLVKPKLIVALGRVAAQRLLVTDAPLSKLRGALHAWGPDATPLMVTYHPAYLLRSPGEKAKSWDDLKKIHKFLNPA